jgi:hypothetical protein
MKRVGWLSVGIVLVIAAASAISLAPSIASAARGPSTSPAIIPAGSSEPTWNSGNLCTTLQTTTTVSGHIVVTCNAETSGNLTYTPNLWYNFSAGEVENTYIYDVWIYGSLDCINLNFHSFYSEINIYLLGSGYVCPTAGGPNQVNSPAGSSAPGVNVVVNSEGDTMTVYQLGSAYQSAFFVYGTTTDVNFVLTGSFLSPTVFFEGTTAGFATCPSGITFGRVVLRGVSTGAYNTLSTIWIDGTNTMTVPPNVSYYTVWWTPLTGGLGKLGHDKLGFEVTQAVPSGSCSYLYA